MGLALSRGLRIDTDWQELFFGCDIKRQISEWMEEERRDYFTDIERAKTS